MKKRIFADAHRGTFSKSRFFFLLIFFFFAFLSLYYRSFYLHVMPDRRLDGLAKRQYRTKLQGAIPRGNIYDSQGEDLAVSVPTDSVALRPLKVRDREKMAQGLRQILKLSQQDVQGMLSSGKKYLWVKRNLTPGESKALHESSLEGLEFVKEAKRFYPNRELASQILGAVGRDGEGLGGVELRYEDYLRGDQEQEYAFRDARGKTFQADEDLSIAENVSHLYLTLQKNIQYAAETEIEDACHTYRARACTGVVMDTRTGAILAMASYPHFNPNQYGNYDLSLWRNLAVTDIFEPGSIFKVILSAAALESGMVSPEDKFFCENGQYQIGSNTIHDHAKYGLLSFREILKVSSNIGTFKVAQKTGKNNFDRTLRDFGFGDKTGIDYPGEVTGQVRPVGSWQDIDFANMAFGQGISVTALQITSAFAAIANRGIRMRPYLVSKITDFQERTLWEMDPIPLKQVISEQAALRLSEMMEEVTTEGGTGTKAALPGYRVAGKTGTAQKLENGRYSHSKFMSSFVGFVPADDPRLTILVTIDEPQGQVYGGQVAAPAFRKIAWHALRELGISPTPVAPKNGVPVQEASLVPWGMPGVLAAAQAVPIPVRDVPQGVSLETPDFSGLSMRQVLQKLDRSEVVVRFYGSGVAVGQRPPPGTVLKNGDVCQVTFKRKLGSDNRL